MKAFCLGGLLVPLALHAQALTIAEHLGGTFTQTATDFRGQSFITVGDAVAYDHITFNFFYNSLNQGLIPHASGVGYLFSSPVSGGPSSMSSSSPGFLGAATASGGYFTFDQSLTLITGSQYYFYLRTPSSFETSGGNYAGGSGYITSGGFASEPWSANGDYNFRVTGSAVSDTGVSPVSETGTSFWLLGLSVFGLFGRRRLTLIRGW